MKIGICNDHAGVDYKNSLIEYLTSKGYEMVNFGTDTTASMDYPDVAHKLATAVEHRYPHRQDRIRKTYRIHQGYALLITAGYGLSIYLRTKYRENGDHRWSPFFVLIDHRSPCPS